MFNHIRLNNIIIHTRLLIQQYKLHQADNNNAWRNKKNKIFTVVFQLKQLKRKPEEDVQDLANL